MNGKRAIFRHWRELGITTKFTVAFGLMLAMMALIAIVSILSLVLVLRETESAIVTSAEIQRLVLEMDGSLQEARRLEKDFFWRYPTIGYSAAYQEYAQPAERQIAHARSLSAKLLQLISEADVSGAWRDSDVNLNLYLSAAARHAATVEEAAALVARLADDETGLQALLAERSSALRETLQSAEDPGLMVLYREMQSLEKEYLITRRRPLMQAAFNAAVPLREAIDSASTLGPDQKTQAVAHLDNYLDLAEKTVELDVGISGKFREFDLQAEAIDPISEELIALADQEVRRARAQIGQTDQLVTAVVVVTTLMGLALAVGIALVLNNDITRNVVKLTQVAAELQAGNLQVRSQIDSADELGQLAGSFNDMAARLSLLIGSLEQKVAERTEALRQERDRAQKYLDIAGALIVVLNERGEVTLINRRGCEILGYEQEEIISKNWFDSFMPVRVRDQASSVFHKLMAGEIEPVEYYENPVSTQSGEERVIAWHSTLLEGDERSIVGTLSSGEDITERKRAEDEVARLAKFPSENPSPVLRVAQDGTLLYANQSASSLLDVWGCQVSETLPEHWHEFAAGVLSSGTGKDAEVEAGDRILSLTFAPVVDAEYVNVYGLDITERKRAEGALRESEESYRRIFNNSAVALWEMDFSAVREYVEDLKKQGAKDLLEHIAGNPESGLELQSRIGLLNINDTTLSMFKANTREELYDSFWNVVTDSSKRSFLRCVKALDDGEPVYNSEQHHKTVDGEDILVELTATVVPGSEETWNRVLITLQDITDRKQAEEALREYSERLKEMVEERTRELEEAHERLVRQEKLAVLGQLAGGVGHELRNPLGAIKNATYFLSIALEDPAMEIQETLGVLEEEADTAEEIISSLLDFARTRPPIRRKVDLNDLVQEALSRTPLPDASLIEVVLQLDEDLPLIMGDPDQLSQVFDNIIRNGIQALPPLSSPARAGEEEARLVIKSECRGDPGGRPEWVTVSFADSGEGISEENMEKIFEPLFTTKAKGIGLGLAVVKNLVEGHGGSINVESDVGKGSTFMVRLPLGASSAMEGEGT